MSDPNIDAQIAEPSIEASEALEAQLSAEVAAKAETEVVEEVVQPVKKRRGRKPKAQQPQKEANNSPSKITVCNTVAIHQTPKGDSPVIRLASGEFTLISKKSGWCEVIWGVNTRGYIKVK